MYQSNNNINSNNNDNDNKNPYIQSFIPSYNIGGSKSPDPIPPPSLQNINNNVNQNNNNRIIQQPQQQPLQPYHHQQQLYNQYSNNNNSNNNNVIYRSPPPPYQQSQQQQPIQIRQPYLQQKQNTPPSYVPPVYPHPSQQQPIHRQNRSQSLPTSPQLTNQPVNYYNQRNVNNSVQNNNSNNNNNNNNSNSNNDSGYSFKKMSDDLTKDITYILRDIYKDTQFESSYSSSPPPTTSIPQRRPIPQIPNTPPTPNLNTQLKSSNGIHAPTSESVLLEGCLFYNVLVMSEPKGNINDNRWFVQRGQFLFNHLAKDMEEVDVLDLKRLIINIDIRLLDDSNSLRYGFRLRTPNASIAHFLWTTDAKQCIMWLVSIGSYTLNFNQEKESEMINQILEISQPESKPKKILNSSNSRNSSPNLQSSSASGSPFSISNLSIFDTTNLNPNGEIGRMEDIDFDNLLKKGLDIFKSDSQKKTIKSISKNLDNKESIIENISNLLLNQEFELGKTFTSLVMAIEDRVLGGGDNEKIAIDVNNIIYEYTQTILLKMPDLRTTEARISYTRLSVEKSVYSFIYQFILSIYTHKYSLDDETFSSKVMQLLTVTTIHIGIPKVFWLLNNNSGGDIGGDGGDDQKEYNNSATTVDQDEINNIPPYQDSIDILKKLPSLTTPSEKLQCIESSIDAISESIKFYWKNKFRTNGITNGTIPQVSADELLPIFSYVIIKSNISNSLSECMFIQDYSDFSQIPQKQQYCLTTFEAALKNTLDWTIENLIEDASKKFDEFKSQNDSFNGNNNSQNSPTSSHKKRSMSSSTSLPSSSFTSPLNPLSPSMLSNVGEIGNKSLSKDKDIGSETANGIIINHSRNNSGNLNINHSRNSSSNSTGTSNIPKTLSSSSLSILDIDLPSPSPSSSSMLATNDSLIEFDLVLSPTVSTKNNITTINNIIDD